MRLDLCVKFPPQTIASAAIYLSAKKMSFPLPELKLLFSVFDTDIDTVKFIADKIISLYNLEKVLIFYYK